MGRSSAFGDDENRVKKGPWTVEEDQKLVDHIRRHGHGSWRALPKLAGLNRCGKSCRLRWTNYLRPDIKRGKFSHEEEQLIINLHSVLGNKWSTIATHLPGRTDNEIKNFWNTHLRKKLLQMGVDPITHGPRADLNLLLNLPHLLAINPININVPTNWDVNALISSHFDATQHHHQQQQQQLAKIQWLQNMLQVLSSTSHSPSPSPFPSSTSAMESLNLLGSHDVQPLLDQQHLCGSSHQLERLGGFVPNPLLQNIPSTFPNGNRHQLIDQNPKFECFTTYNNNDIINTQTNVLPTANSIPALVSASPERCGFSQMENKINPTDHHHHHISYPSSTSTPFGSSGELMDDEAADDQSYWRDIIEQAYSSSP